MRPVAYSTPLSPSSICVSGGFWGPRIDTNRQATLPAIYRQLRKTGRLSAATWKPGKTGRPHVFWNSDVAKWIEAGAYSLMAYPNRVLEKQIDGYVAAIAGIQQPDGYLNDYFCLVEPDKRWTNLRDAHELYCAGHLMEAAVAYHQATGKRQLLDIVARFADHIDQTFGRARGKRRGYPGHEEIELALVKLAEETGDARYLDLSAYFVLERGRRPHYFDRESRARGEKPRGAAEYHQAHRPVVEQTEAVGHSVRALYLYAGMADVATRTGNRDLLAACRRLWRSVTTKRMYVTGGVGDTRQGERFTCDHDLPNEFAYAETCAAIALVFFANRMLNAEHDGRYGDVMERALYNGVLSGVSLDGTRFFYENPLSAAPRIAAAYGLNRGSGSVQRQPWFGTACCPPNIARLLASLGSYAYSQRGGRIGINLFVDSTAEFDIGSGRVGVTQRTGYPWKEQVDMDVSPDHAMSFSVAVRIPGWCRTPSLTLNGTRVELTKVVRRGYAVLRRTWKPGDRLTLSLPMPVERIEAHPAVRQDCGRIALQRGPVVYCLEQVDNGPNLHDLVIARNARLTASYAPTLLGGCVTIRGTAMRRSPTPWRSDLYRADPTPYEKVGFRAVPYALWGNRGEGEMVVWVRKSGSQTVG